MLIFSELCLLGGKKFSKSLYTNKAIKTFANTQHHHTMSNIDHPSHYGGEGNLYEAIKVIEAWELDFCLGNVVKYISRAGKKDSKKTVEDLQKAQWYLQRRISQLIKTTTP